MQGRWLAKRGVVLVAGSRYRSRRSPRCAPSRPARPPPAKPLVPVATNTVTANPDALYGEGVTMTAAVGEIVSKSAFSVDQRKVGPGNTAQNSGHEMLVLAPTLNTPVDLNACVTVMGEVVKFDPAEIAKKAKDYKLDLSPEAVEKYRGRPVLLATAVINEKFVDLAKKPLPPMTADEIAPSNVMKQVAKTRHHQTFGQHAGQNRARLGPDRQPDPELARVRPLTENASTPATPTMEIASATPANPPKTMAFRRSGASTSARTSSSVAARSTT